ncbi:MAG: hypothetical protein CMJ78_01825 [Planctomycetaceae bacterium]|nr:hypothetical protein [Planctomycetaceae bacterium]
MQSSSKLAQNINGHTYFAEVTVALKKKPCEALQIDFDEVNAVDWRNAAAFGIEYAWNQIGGPFRTLGMNVKVMRIHGFPTDTTPIMVAYVAADATWKLANIEPQSRPTLDDLGEGIFFPR